MMMIQDSSLSSSFNPLLASPVHQRSSRDTTSSCTSNHNDTIFLQKQKLSSNQNRYLKKGLTSSSSSSSILLLPIVIGFLLYCSSSSTSLSMSQRRHDAIRTTSFYTAAFSFVPTTTIIQKGESHIITRRTSSSRSTIYRQTTIRNDSTSKKQMRRRWYTYRTSFSPLSLSTTPIPNSNDLSSSSSTPIPPSNITVSASSIDPLLDPKIPILSPIEETKTNNVTLAKQPIAIVTTASAAVDQDTKSIHSTITKEESKIPVSRWPSGDALDKRLLKLSVPVIINNAISPLIGAVDLFWVSQMGNPLAIAGQAAANQVFNSIFWLSSFLPNVSATLISKENAAKNTKGVEEAISQALFIGIFMAIIPTVWLICNPNQILGTILPDPTSPALQYAKPYLLIRSLAFVPSLISVVGFSAFRGTMDTITPVKISFLANLLNAVLDPILIFTLGMGVPGAALATLGAEIISAILYLFVLRKRKLIPNNLLRLFRIPSWKRLQPLIQGGAALQIRNVALNLTFLMVARVTQGIDTTRGIAASAHAMAIQTFQLGGIVLLALSVVAQTIIPNDIVDGGKDRARETNHRLLSWGLIAGGILGLAQIAVIPIIQRTTPIQEVRDAARIPAILGSIYQLMNGIVFIGEGIMVGCGNFLQLSAHTVVATIGCLWALQTFPPKYGLTGVWIGFGVFNSIRLLGVLTHQLFTGPLAHRNRNRPK